MAKMLRVYMTILIKALIAACKYFYVHYILFTEALKICIIICMNFEKTRLYIYKEKKKKKKKKETSKLII
jgi:hypothetical protein